MKVTAHAGLLIPFLGALAAFTLLGADDYVPPGRSAHALVYDRARREILAFGGAGEASGALWAWDGAVWTQRAGSGPVARELPALAYDSKRQRVVLHGGRAGRAALNDTWEWDGRAWIQIAVPGPPAREHAQMAYDPATARIVLFGGVGANDRSFADTWAYDGRTWTKLADVEPGQAPHQRAINGVVFDGSRGALLMVASDLSARSAPAGLFPTEVWEWRNASWTRLSADGPPLSPVQSLAPDPDGGFVLLNADVPGEQAVLWRWRQGRWSRVPADGPSTRFGAALATDIERRVVVMFGGETRDHQRLLEDTWEWNGVSWRKAQGLTAPPAPSRTAPLGAPMAALALAMTPSPLVEDLNCLCGGLPNRVSVIGRLTIRETGGVGLRLDSLRAVLRADGPPTALFTNDFTAADVAGHANGVNTIGASGSLTLIDVGGHFDRGQAGQPSTMTIEVRGTDDRRNPVTATLSVPVRASSTP